MQRFERGGMRAGKWFLMLFLGISLLGCSETEIKDRMKEHHITVEDGKVKKRVLAF